MDEIIAGKVFKIEYPFIRDVYQEFDEDGVHDTPTWSPGVRFEWVGPGDTAPVADAIGEAVFTVIDIHKPGRFPTRVFFTRQFINPDGKVFGKGKLHIVTLEKFRRLARGYRYPFGIEEPLPPTQRRNISEAAIRFAQELADFRQKEAQ